MVEDECSENQTTTTSTEMSVVETHVVALKLTGENVETKEEGTKIKGYRFKTLKKFLRSQCRGDIKWFRPKPRQGRGS